MSERSHSFSRSMDLVALVTLETVDSSHGGLDKKTLHKITELLSSSSGDKKLEALRASGQQVLMKFSSAKCYETLGKCFLEGKLDAFAGFKLVELQCRCQA